MESRLLLNITGGRRVTTIEVLSFRKRLTNRKECDRPPAVFQRRSAVAGREEF